MTENRFTKANRETKVLSVQITRSVPGDPFHPSKKSGLRMGLEDAELDGPIWHVWVDDQTGFDHRGSSLSYFSDEGAAMKFANAHPEGSVWSDSAELFPLNLRECYGDNNNNLEHLLSAGSDDFFKCYDVLLGAGVKTRGGGTAQAVLDWFDDAYIRWLKNEFGENWSVAAELEYCTRHFPRSSLAYLATRIFFNYFIRADDFSTGYLLRELELIMGGAEEVATSAMATRRNAGVAGSKASRTAKSKRLESFMQEVENLGDLFPRMSEHSILDQAFQNAIQSDRNSWRQGQGRQQEYEVELRSDKKFKSRYFAIFLKTA